MLRRPITDRPVGDVIPFYDEERSRYHLFYLAVQPDATADDRLRGVTWEHISSADFVDWVQHPTAVSPGATYDRDGAYTGSVIRRGSEYHLFYTGVNDDSPFAQAICHAISDDLETFVKSDQNPILSAAPGYQPGDWRDPFVRWDAATDEYVMLISTRATTAPAFDRGALAIAHSKDLVEWRVDDQPMLRPVGAYVPECAEVHRIGEEYLLAFSTFTGDSGISYFRSPRATGPWSRIAGYSDGPRWYAGKSLQDAAGRLITFGWIPDRAGHDNSATLVWGGDFAIPREIWIDDTGMVCQRPLAEALAQFENRISVVPDAFQGSGPFAFAKLAHLPHDQPMLISGRLTWTSGEGVAGLLLHSDAALTTGLRVAIDRARGRVELREITQEHTHMVVTPPGPWVSHAYRPVDGIVQFEVILDGSCVEIFLDGKLAMTHRYHPSPGAAAVKVFSEDADVTFSDIWCSTPSAE